MSRGGGQVKALFDIDHTVPIQGRVPHPFFWYSWWFGDIYRDYFTYTASIKADLLKNTNGSWVDASSDCTSSSILDPGSRIANDPFIQCTFDEEGEYAIKVYSHVDFAETSLTHGHANRFYNDDDYGVLYNQSYDLVISVQRHDINTKTIDLANTLFTFTDGDQAGTSGQIESYNSSRQEYLVRSINPASDTSQFEISSSTFEFYKDTETGISPGQACVFYLKDEIGERVLGGGWIDKTENKNLST